MNHILLFSSAILLTSLWTSNGLSLDVRQIDDCPHWSYEGATGPTMWAELCPDHYYLCGNGTSQSPIDIITSTPSDDLKPFDFTSYDDPSNEIINLEHTIQIPFGHNFSMMHNSVLFQEKEYHLAQLHFHTPSEHSIDSQAFPMEVHLVHRTSEATDLLVLSVLFTEGEENPTLANIISQIPNTTDSEEPLQPPVDPSSLLPEDRTYYYYVGSLTTPPCSEGVQWFVMLNPLSASQSQMDEIQEWIGISNRPLQNLNGREVQLLSIDSESSKVLVSISLLLTTLWVALVC